MASGLPGAVLGSNQGNILSTNSLLSCTERALPSSRPELTQSMNSSSAPDPSICGLARMTTRSPLASGVASSRDSSMRACMHPVSNTTPRHAIVMLIELFMDALPDVMRDVDGRTEVCHVAASPLCDLEAPVGFPTYRYSSSDS